MRIKKKFQQQTQEVFEVRQATETAEIVKARLKNLFKSHIGEANAINSYTIFTRVMQYKPDDIDFYKREFIWALIKRTMSAMRREGEVFVIRNSDNYFVVSTVEEAGYYKRELERDIKNMKSAIKNCYDYVEKKKFKELMQGENKQ